MWACEFVLVANNYFEKKSILARKQQQQQQQQQTNEDCEITSEMVDWKEEMIQEMMAIKMKPNGMMKILNKFILVKGLPDDFISPDTIRRIRKKMLKKKIAKQKGGNFIYLGCDARKDKTLMPNNQTAAEEHLTFVSTQGYICHKTMENKLARTSADKIMQTLEETNSLNSLKILSTDGENCNTGQHGKILKL